MYILYGVQKTQSKSENDRDSGPGRKIGLISDQIRDWQMSTNFAPKSKEPGRTPPHGYVTDASQDAQNDAEHRDAVSAEQQSQISTRYTANLVG